MPVGKIIKKLSEEVGAAHSSSPVAPRRINTQSGGVQPTQATTIRADRGGVRENEGTRRRRERMGGADANIIRTEAEHTGYRE